MPKVNLTQNQKVASRHEYLKRWYKGKLREAGLIQKDIADALGVTQGTINQRLKDGTISAEMLIALSTLADIEAEELKRVLTL